jgi:hypothetical protein
MGWSKILLTKDQVKTGEIKRFHQKFRKVFQEAGQTNEMGLFAGLPLQDGELPFYLTPVCSRLAENLITEYSGVPCEKPHKSGLEPTLVIGFNRAWDLLME